MKGKLVTWSAVHLGQLVFLTSHSRYEDARRLQVAVIHGLARMTPIMASTYKAYLGVGLGPLSFLTNFRIPHPVRVGGRFLVDIGTSLMLIWVLGDNGLKGDHISANSPLK